MLGAIIGDIAGSRWEFNATNNYNFTLFSEFNDFTDDTICTVAIAEAILYNSDFGQALHKWCQQYPLPMGGYGMRFASWCRSDNPQPFNSYGNGAAMRVSAVAWAAKSFDEVVENAKRSAECTHNHPEGIKGAQTTAIAIFDCAMLFAQKTEVNKQSIMQALKRAIDFSNYDININRQSVINIFDETCQGTVPVALWIISNSNSFEDAIRQAVSLGADADTLAAIVGSIAEAIWGIPEDLKNSALKYLPQGMVAIIENFYNIFIAKP